MHRHSHADHELIACCMHNLLPGGPDKRDNWHGPTMMLRCNRAHSYCEGNCACDFYSSHVNSWRSSDACAAAAAAAAAVGVLLLKE